VVENGQKVAGGTKLNKRGRSAVVRRTSRKISFSPRKVTTNTSVNNKKNQKKNPPFNPEEDIIKEEEKIVQNGVQPVETPQILNGAKTVQNGAQPAETPHILNGAIIVQNGAHPIETPQILNGAPVETPRIQNGAKIVQNGDHPIETPQILNGAPVETPRIQNGAKIVQNGNHPIETPQILNGAPVETPRIQNGATFETPRKTRIEGVSETPPHTNPEEVQEGSTAGNFVKIFFSKLKLFFQFLFLCALLFILFDEFLKPTLSELFWGFLGDEFYQTLVFPTPPSLQLLH